MNGEDNREKSIQPSAIVQKPANQIGRRGCILGTAGALMSIFTAFSLRFELRQKIKEALAPYPDALQAAVMLEEFGPQILNMTVKVRLYPINETGMRVKHPERTPLFDEVTDFQEAVDYLYYTGHVTYDVHQFIDPGTGIFSEDFRLTPDLAANSPICAVLGVNMETPAGESLPEGTIAKRVVFPKSAKAILAPAVSVPNHVHSHETDFCLRKYTDADYQALGLPGGLLSQTVLSLGHEGLERQVVPHAERMIIDGQDYTGKEFASGEIAEGTVYLWADGEDWGLASWPDNRLHTPNTGCARMIWDLNPHVGVERKFRPYESGFYSEQSAQQEGYLNSLTVHVPYDKIGPTAVFRYDRERKEGDMVFMAPFLPLVSPETMEKILTGTSVGSHSELPSGNNLLIAMGDAHYGTMCGFNPAILEQPDGVTGGIFDTSRGESGQGPVTDFSNVNNSLALYIGI